MPVSRRDFIVRSGVALAATLAPGRLLAAVEKQTPAPAPLSRWADVRAQFALAPGYLHFSSFFITSHPRPVRDAIEAFRKALDANPFLTVERGMFESETANLQRKVCEDLAGYLGGKPEEVALVANTTTGLALVYHGLPLAAGDEVLTTTHDHYVHHESIRLAAERAGATWRKVALFENAASASVDEIVGRVRSAIGPNTRVLGVTWVHSSTGMRLPIRAIADAVREVNDTRAEKDHVVLVVDGVHGLGAVEEKVADLGADFFCAGTHKWMFAPRGTGIVWANGRNWSRLRPTIPSFSEFESYMAWQREEPPAGPTVAWRVTPGGFQAFEHQWAMGAAFRFHQQIGPRRIAERIRTLNDQCKAGLARIPRVTVHTPRDPALSAGLVAFEVEGLKPDEVVARLLDRHVIASASPYRVSYPRLAPSLVNGPEEVESALAAVRAIAAA